MKWSVEAAIVLAGVLIATSIALTNHWQISAVGYGLGAGYPNESVYRLNRWSGHVEHCVLVADPNLPKNSHAEDMGTDVQCPAPAQVPYNAKP